MKFRTTSIFLAFVSLIFFTALAPQAMADVTIGNGFTCSGTTLLKGGKEVTFTKAKSTLKRTIERLKDKLADAPKKKKAKIKEQLAAAKADKIQLTGCISGNLDSSQVDQIFKTLASGSGKFSGTYNGTATLVGAISGPVEVTFELNGTVFGASLSIGGPVGNALFGEPLAFQNDVGGIGFPAQFFLTGTFLGDVSLTITQAGHVTITNSNSSKGSITFEGDLADPVLSATLSGSYSFVQFSGSATLTRQ